MIKKTILAADGCRKTADKLSGLLVKEGYDVISSNSGIDTVEKAIVKQPDLIILGVVLHEMNSYQTYRLLKNDSGTMFIPIIMLTYKDEYYQEFFGPKSAPDESMDNDYDSLKLLEAVKGKLNGKGKTDRAYPAAKVKTSVNRVDIINKLNSLLDQKCYEVALFSDLTGLVKNIFSFDDLALAIMDIFSRVIDYSAAMIIVISEEETKLSIHLHKKIDNATFTRMKESAIEKFKEGMDGFDPENMWIKTVSEERIVNKRKDTNNDNLEIIFNEFSNSGILKKGIILFGHHENKIDKNKLELLNIIINETCIILENSWLYSKLYKNVKNMTITDGLTGIFNHKHLMSVVKQEFNRAKRYKHNISVIMFDIDHFKEVNDTFGHQTGDVILREISSIIKDTVRKSDIVGRYGGEEFTIVLIETDIGKAQVFAERLREKVEKYSFFNPADPLRITASMGLVSYPKSEVDTPKSLIMYADQALYEAKNNGRNRVCVYGNHN